VQRVRRRPPVAKEKTPSLPTDPRTQAAKFTDLARELECNEDEAAFEETVRRVAKAPPPEEPRVER
jgi:hypothetical protein